MIGCLLLQIFQIAVSFVVVALFYSKTKLGLLKNYMIPAKLVQFGILGYYYVCIFFTDISVLANICGLLIYVSICFVEYRLYTFIVHHAVNTTSKFGPYAGSFEMIEARNNL